MFIKFYYKSFLATIICLSLCSSINAHNQHLITFKAEKNNVCGNIYTYSLAKWLSYKYCIPFHPAQFASAEVFSITSQNEILKKELNDETIKTITIYTEDELIDYLNTQKTPTLFVIEQTIKIHISSSLGESIDWPDKYSNLYSHIVNHASLGNDLALKMNIEKPHIVLPEDKISVAVYIRKGTLDDLPLVSVQYADEWDNALAQKKCNPFFAKGADVFSPLQFPPEQFYLDQIKNLSIILYDTPMYVCIFTDDTKPEKIVAQLRKRINKSNITITSYQTNAGAEKNENSMLQEIYAMTLFDCLIRPESEIAFTAQLIGNHKIVISPQTANTQHEKALNQFRVIINNTSILFHNQHAHFVKYCPILKDQNQNKQSAIQTFKH